MKFLDLVIGGCDSSGKSTQVKGLIKYFQSIGNRVRDIRGTELDAMFHVEALRDFNKDFINLDEFSRSHPFVFQELLNRQIYALMEKNGCYISSMVHNKISEYIDPNSADVWVMEEPSKRGAGQTVRTIELNRSQWGSESNQAAAAYAHQAYRTEEYFRYRQVLRELRIPEETSSSQVKKKKIVRSRSEESGSYQIFDDENHPGGVSRDIYLNLPGHKIAFGNPPTHIFVVCGPENWTPEQYLELKKQRADGRLDDDYEKDAPYEVMVNHRYATSWLEEFYEEGCRLHGGQVPNITRFDIYDPKEVIEQKMIERLKVILEKELAE